MERGRVFGNANGNAGALPNGNRHSNQHPYSHSYSHCNQHHYPHKHSDRDTHSGSAAYGDCDGYEYRDANADAAAACASVPLQPRKRSNAGRRNCGLWKVREKTTRRETFTIRLCMHRRELVEQRERAKEIERRRALGENVRLLRKSQNMTQRRLAKLVGISVTMISMVENGKVAPSFDRLCDIAWALDMQEWDEMLCGVY